VGAGLPMAVTAVPFFTALLFILTAKVAFLTPWMPPLIALIGFAMVGSLC
jgi:hypothetical protein